MFLSFDSDQRLMYSLQMIMLFWKMMHYFDMKPISVLKMNAIILN